MASPHAKAIHRNIVENQDQWEQRYNLLVFSARVGIAFAGYKLAQMIVLVFGPRPVDAEAQMWAYLVTLLITLTLAYASAKTAQRHSRKYARANARLPQRRRREEPDVKFWK
jgi:hypothetical protein